MRNEKEVYKQILEFAKREDKIRGVILIGSRVNSNAPVDMFQDYDVVMVTKDADYYKENKGWMKQFGETVIVQHNINEDKSHIYLMLFTDLVRIDMIFLPLEVVNTLEEDSLIKVLLDKDNRLPKYDKPSEKSYYVKRPTEKEFDYEVNEFFWCLNNVAKGIYRDELVYVKMMYEWIVKKPLIKMIKWHIGVNYDFKVNPGKLGKWFKRYLSHDLYELLKKTYSGDDYDEIWDSIFASCQLMRIVGQQVAHNLGFQYPISDDEMTVKYLEAVRNIK